MRKMDNSFINKGGQNFTKLLESPQITQLSAEAKIILATLGNKNQEQIGILHQQLVGNKYVDAIQELALSFPYYEALYNLTYYHIPYNTKLIYLGFINSLFLFDDISKNEFEVLMDKLDIANHQIQVVNDLIKKLGKSFFSTKVKDELIKTHELNGISEAKKLILLGFELHMGDLFFNDYFYDYPDEFYGQFKYHKDILRVCPRFYDDCSEDELYPESPELSLNEVINQVNHNINKSNIYSFEWRFYGGGHEKKAVLFGYFDSEYHFKIKIEFINVQFSLVESFWQRQGEKGSFRIRELSDQEKTATITNYKLDLNNFFATRRLITIEFLPQGSKLPNNVWQTHLIDCSGLKLHTGLFDKTSGSQVLVQAQTNIKVSNTTETFSLGIIDEGFRRWKDFLEKEGSNLLNLFSVGQGILLNHDSLDIITLIKSLERFILTLEKEEITINQLFGITLDQNITLPIPSIHKKAIGNLKELLKTLTYFSSIKSDILLQIR